jgi:hypothetical protein
MTRCMSQTLHVEVPFAPRHIPTALSPTRELSHYPLVMWYSNEEHALKTASFDVQSLIFTSAT